MLQFQSGHMSCFFGFLGLVLKVDFKVLCLVQHRTERLCLGEKKKEEAQTVRANQSLPYYIGACYHALTSTYDGECGNVGLKVFVSYSYNTAAMSRFSMCYYIITTLISRYKNDQSTVCHHNASHLFFVHLVQLSCG